MCNQTTEWALDKASKAEEAGDLTEAEKYQKIAESCIVNPNVMEKPVGATGYFVKAERRGVTNFLM